MMPAVGTDIETVKQQLEDFKVQKTPPTNYKYYFNLFSPSYLMYAIIYGLSINTFLIGI